METVVIRYGELGTKSDKVRSDMTSILRQRVQDRLKFEGEEFEKVSTVPGRIICRDVRNPESVADIVSEIPGVASASPVISTESSIEAMKEASERLEVGESFGIDANTAGEHSFDSQDIERELGSYVKEKRDLRVDLDEPETVVEVDARFEETFIFTERFEGPQGFPEGAGDDLAALISGGIDSPVAAYETMKKGSKITPIYFYNKPLAAEDHLIRFKSVIKKLKRFNPSRDWKFFIVDMEEVNKQLMDQVEKGRMLIHRRIMFRVAEKIAEQENLSGIVTGESLAQKSSQTASNLDLTSRSVDKNILRPLLTEDKHSITSKARELGTFEDSTIESACNTLAPQNPATRMDNQELQEKEERIDIDSLVQKAVNSMKTEKI